MEKKYLSVYPCIFSDSGGPRCCFHWGTDEAQEDTSTDKAFGIQ